MRCLAPSIFCTVRQVNCSRGKLRLRLQSSSVSIQSSPLRQSMFGLTRSRRSPFARRCISWSDYVAALPRIGRPLWRMCRNHCLLSTLVRGVFPALVSFPFQKDQQEESHGVNSPSQSGRSGSVHTGDSRDPVHVSVQRHPSVPQGSDSSGSVHHILPFSAPGRARIRSDYRCGPYAPAEDQMALGPRLVAPPFLLFTCVDPAFHPFRRKRATPLHIFVTRYRLVAIPGLALCYGFVIKRIDSPKWRSAFCTFLVTATALYSFASPRWNAHGYTWKYATDFTQKNTAADHAPVLICSDLPESNFMSMPLGNEVYDSTLFPSLTYYKLSAPVVALPRTFGKKTVRIASAFLQEAAGKKKRSWSLRTRNLPTLSIGLKGSSSNFDVHTLGTFDAVRVVEFVPRLDSPDDLSAIALHKPH